MLATLFPTLYGNVTAPAVLEIDAAVPVAVSAALLIQAPPVTRRPVSTRPATPAATLPDSRFSGWRDCHRNHAPATKVIRAPTYIAVEAAKPPAVENSCAMVWTCAPIVPPAAWANAPPLASIAPPSAAAPRSALASMRTTLRVMRERSFTGLSPKVEPRGSIACPSSPRVQGSLGLARRTKGEIAEARKSSSGYEHRDERVGDRQDVDEHDPEHELHDASRLTAIGLAIDDRSPGEEREEGAHRPEILEERLKQRHDIDERRARARTHQGARVGHARRRVARERGN